MSTEPEPGLESGKSKSGKSELKLIDLGDATVETKQWGGGTFPDSAMVPSSYPVI
jgi:hypothetical protein